MLLEEAPAPWRPAGRFLQLLKTRSMLAAEASRSPLLCWPGLLAPGLLAPAVLSRALFDRAGCGGGSRDRLRRWGPGNSVFIELRDDQIWSVCLLGLNACAGAPEAPPQVAAVHRQAHRARQRDDAPLSWPPA
jgi:hypothetical protein